MALLGTFTAGVLLKSTCNAEKQDKVLTKIEANRDKFFIDSVSNINTVQKMQALGFINEKGERAKKDCLRGVRNWATIKEIGFAGYKLISYAYLPIVCLLVFLFPDTVKDRVEFFSFLAVVCIQFVHNAKSVANTLVKISRFRASKQKLKEIIRPENKRRELLKINDFKKAEIFSVKYRYKDNDKTVTVNIPYFELNKGDRVCIYGESGQGKTTLLNILSGEIETNGVFVNGKKIDKRLDCVFISQDTEILDMSIRDNLTLGNRNITDNQILKMLKEGGLQEWFNKQSDGLDTLLGERGTFVSTGQRQRLNFIRGLLTQNKEIYLLDEPTSNVDEETEKKLISMIQKYLKNKTVVIVTHRPAIKQVCNKFYKYSNSVLEPVK